MNLAPDGYAVAAAVDTQATIGGDTWIVVGALALVLLVGSSVRVVSEHERVVVSRLGRSSRVVGPGLVFHLPGLERLTTVSLRPVHVDLIVSAITRDGVPVRLTGSAAYRVTDPSRSTAAAPDPFGATAAELESQLAREVAHHDLSALLPSREEIETRLPREATTVTADWGVDVLEFGVDDIETRLTADLLRSVERQPEVGGGERV